MIHHTMIQVWPNYITDYAGNQYIVTRISLDVYNDNYITIVVRHPNIVFSLYFGVPDIKEAGISAFYNNYSLKSASNNNYSYGGDPGNGRNIMYNHP